MKKYATRIFMSLAIVIVILVVIRKVMPPLFGNSYFDNEYLIEGILKLLFLIVTIFILRREKLINWQYTYKNLKITTAIVMICIYFSLQHLSSSKFQNIMIPTARHLSYLFNCLATGFFEEYFFRILIFTYVYKIFNHSQIEYFKPVLLTSVLFGVVHITNFITGNTDIVSSVNQIIFASSIGIVFQSLFFRFNNIFLISLLHATINYNGMMSSKLFKIPIISGNTVFYEELFQTIVTFSLFAVFIIIPIVYFSLKNRHNVLIKE